MNIFIKYTTVFLLFIMSLLLKAQNPGDFLEPPYYPYDSVAVKPSFAGGQTVLNAWLDSAKTVLNTTDTGTVKVWFIIEKDGTINNARTIEGTGKTLDSEAERIISQMPAWIPGKKNNADVATEMIIYIQF